MLVLFLYLHVSKDKVCELSIYRFRLGYVAGVVLLEEIVFVIGQLTVSRMLYSQYTFMGFGWYRCDREAMDYGVWDGELVEHELECAAIVFFGRRSACT